MKKVLTVILCVMIMSMVTCAFAETKIEWNGSDTVNLHSWSSPATSSGARWHIEWGNSTNIASDRRALVRVHSGYDAASASWVYSTKSTAYHDYNSGFGYGLRNTELWGRLDNRDGARAPLKVDGYFFN